MAELDNYTALERVVVAEVEFATPPLGRGVHSWPVVGQ
jgi:hypothetical protein